MMKSKIFYKKDEVVLSMATFLVVMALTYQGVASLLYTKEHAIFQSYAAGSKK